MNVKRAQGSFGISLGARSAVIWSSTESVELLPLQCRNQDEFSSHSQLSPAILANAPIPAE